jgi:hypothetical protein
MNAIQKEKSKQALRIFLSYASADKEDARKLSNMLRGHYNLHIFSSEMLSAGEDWQAKLRDEISKCDLFIVLLSPKSVETGWVLSELGAAWALDKMIISIFTKPEMLSKVPVELKNTESLDISSLDEHPEILNHIIENYKESILINS